jgi:Raf kinase inhibitor-like YbhB/YbcL family protein
MHIKSSAFADGQMIPRRFTCDGEDLAPPLSWSDVPPGTRSFVLICDDPDAPAGTWHHWTAYDIPGDRLALEEGADRHAGRNGFKHTANDFGRMGYGGPCPPPGHGPHRYRFRLIALSVDHLPLRKNPSRRDVERSAQEHALAEAMLVGRYGR